MCSYAKHCYMAGTKYVTTGSLGGDMLVSQAIWLSWLVMGFHLVHDQEQHGTAWHSTA
jgi:hypothetical protein